MNDLAFVRATVNRLDAAGVRCLLFGGWAEDLLGLAAPRAHKDLDLLYAAPSFARVDALLAADAELAEITAKRFAHMRAFETGGVMVELFLVQWDPDGWHTTINGARHDWPAKRLFVTRAAGLRAASPAALASYRVAHPALHAAPA